MRTITILGVVASIALTSLLAEEPHMLSRPALPSAAALARIGLRERWHAYLPMDGKRDGLGPIQVVNGEPNAQVVIQSLSAATTLLDAETGAAVWRNQLAESYRGGLYPAGVNPELVFVAAGLKLYCLDRTTGSIEWQMSLPHVLSTAPVADAERLYVCSNDGRFRVFILPLPKRILAERLAGRPTAGGESAYASLAATLVNPREDVSLQLNGSIYVPPTVLPVHVVLANGNGTVLSYQKELKFFFDKYISPVAVSAPFGQGGTSLFAGFDDETIVAFELDAGKLVINWRQSLSGRLTQAPAALDADVYAAVLGRGLYCLDRLTGAVRWRQPDAVQFVAAGKRVLYARDPHGRLLLLDRAKGSLVATLDTRAFTAAIPNDVSDRVYLANNDGLVLCLQEATATAATYYNRPPRTPAPEKSAEPAPAEEKPVPKPKPEEKPKAGEKPKKDEKPKKEEAPKGKKEGEMEKKG